jgi:phenylpropionate dioxygenase-like ring-hydroxylating dioxygenase large terminal subunit
LKPAAEQELIARLRAEIERPSPCTLADATVSTDAYTSDARAAGERALFRRVPLAVAHASEIAEPGSYVTREIAGVPVLVTRDETGEPRAFVNVCRHRGTRLVDAPCGKAKAFACRYHAWTYDLRGSLVHIPHRETFPTVDEAARGLFALPCEARHGIVWSLLTPGASLDVRAHLGADIDDDLADFGLGDHVVARSVVERRPCNWKLVIEAFLEGYHAKYLHQRTIARFFIDGGVVFDRFGPHVRSAGARRELKKDASLASLRAAATMFYFVFPNTILVFHPDWVSHVTMVPESAGESMYTHAMLVPRSELSRREHWDETWDLIERNVFQAEDLSVASSIQASLSAGVEREFRLGGLELPIRYFHDELESALRQ